MTEPITDIPLISLNHMLTISFIVGLVIRVIKTETISTWLDRLPPSWIGRIPKDALPWICLVLAVAFTIADSLYSGHAKTWQEAAALAVQGVMSGSLAIAGHETLAKTIGKIIPSITSGPSMVVLCILGALTLQGCGSSNAQTLQRSSARAAVLAVTDAVRQSDLECARIVRQTADAALGNECDRVYTSARASLVTAAVAIDTWDKVQDHQSVACALQAAAKNLSALTKQLWAKGAKKLEVVDDALALIALAGECPSPGAT